LRFYLAQTSKYCNGETIEVPLSSYNKGKKEEEIEIEFLSFLSFNQKNKGFELKKSNKKINTVFRTPVDYSYSDKDVTITYCKDYDPYKDNHPHNNHETYQDYTINVYTNEEGITLTEDFWGNKR